MFAWKLLDRIPIKNLVFTLQVNDFSLPVRELGIVLFLFHLILLLLQLISDFFKIFSSAHLYHTLVQELLEMGIGFFLGFFPVIGFDLLVGVTSRSRRVVVVVFE